MKKIAISGASGFVGSSLISALQDRYEIEKISRDDLKSEELLRSKIEGSFAVINLAGAPIVARWSEEYKKILRSSRIESTKSIVNAICSLEKKPEVFISTSAVGIYDSRGTYSEYDKNYGEDFLAKLCADWESEALEAKKCGVRVAIYRFGVVLGKGGGMMEKVMTPFSLGVGGTIGDGKQGFSFVHLHDLIEAETKALEDSSMEGIYNLVAPNPIDNYEFTKTLGKILNRPTILPVPTFALKLLYSEGAKVLSDGQKVLPKRLEESGFEFRYGDISSALKEVVG